MKQSIEIRGFMGLAALFRQRGWGMPYELPMQQETDGISLIKRLEIDQSEVEIIFVNGKVYPPTLAHIQPGDRVALVPPGTPGPYRVLLGFVGRDTKGEEA